MPINSRLLVILLIGFGIRILLAPLFGGFGYDMDALAGWSWHLQFTPLDQFYAFASNPDHLPGDLWFLWLLGTAFRAFGGANFESDTYQFLIKMVPTVADIVIAVSLFAIVERIRDQRTALMAAALYVLNPATIYLTAVWGQWDSVSMALLIAAFSIVLIYERRWLLAVPLIAWAIVIKPPLAPLGLLVLAIPIWRIVRSESSLRVAISRLILPYCFAALIGICSILTVILPFGVGLPGVRTTWQLLDRMGVALDLYPIKTMAATNIWMISQGSLDRHNDEGDLIGGLSAHSLGNILLAIALGGVFLAVVALILRRSSISPDVVITWSMLVASFGIFMLPTRVHERYLFPAIVCSILLAGLTNFDRRVLWIAGATSLSYLLNLAIVYGGFRGSVPDSIGDFVYGPFLVVISLANLAIFISILFLPSVQGIGVVSALSGRSTR